MAEKRASKAFMKDPFAGLESFAEEVGQVQTQPAPTQAAPAKPAFSTPEPAWPDLPEWLQAELTPVEADTPAAEPPQAQADPGLPDWLDWQETGAADSAADQLPKIQAASGPEPGHLQQDDFLSSLIAAIDQETGSANGAAVSSPNMDKTGSPAALRQQFVIFQLAGATYAAPLVNITQTDRAPKITPLPNVPGWLLGVTNLRGDILSMVDLRAFLGLEPTQNLPGARLLVTRAGQDGLMVGLIVDQVAGIHSLELARIHPPAAQIEDQIVPYLRGIYEQEQGLLVILDLERLLLSPAMQQFEPVRRRS